MNAWWAAMMSACARSGIPPHRFWALGVPELLALTSPPGSPISQAPDRRELEEMMQRQPDIQAVNLPRSRQTAGYSGQAHGQQQGHG